MNIKLKLEHPWENTVTTPSINNNEPSIHGNVLVFYLTHVDLAIKKLKKLEVQSYFPPRR